MVEQRNKKNKEKREQGGEKGKRGGAEGWIVSEGAREVKSCNDE